jgi:GNAT superfamily N-acetyltransferase
VDPPLDALIREQRPGDGRALASIWLDNARSYVERFPEDFRLPDEDGLAEFFRDVEALGTATAYQGRGLATLLVERCETWARERGATQISTSTYLASEVSVPFWERRMRFRRKGVNLVKRLREE